MDILSKRDLCVLLTACICHDLDHPGYNNTYQINARTSLAVRYLISHRFSLIKKENMVKAPLRGFEKIDGIKCPDHEEYILLLVCISF